MKNYTVTAVIAAAGKGIRSQLNNNKVFAIMPNGKSVIYNTISTFDKVERISQIVIAANENDFYKITKLSGSFNTPITVVLGGESRTQSVQNALNATCGDIVLVHDGARPFITENAVNRLIDSVLQFGTGVASTQPTDTIATLLPNGEIQKTSRSDMLLLQTPQAFFTDKLKLAYSKIGDDENFTDEAGVYCKYVASVHPVIIEENNAKLTNPNDFDFCEKTVRVGTGFDLHRLVENRPLILGGITIKHDKGLLGHSDADVLTHAVCDALLSTLSLGDIGYHFSDQDEQYKGICSMILLERVLQMVKNQGYAPNNLSAVIMAQKPKLAPYVNEITASLANALGIDKSQVGITCTTTEKTGIIGNEEAIAVQAFCSVKKI